MDVEVQQKDGFFVEATIVSLDSKSVNVHYKNNFKEEDETVPYSQCRVVSSGPQPGKNFKAGDTVEAFIKRNTDSQVPVWQKVKIREIKGDFAVVELFEDSSVSDVCPLSKCRGPVTTQTLSFDKLKTTKIEVPEDLQTYFTDPQNCQDFITTVNNIHVDYQRKQKCLLIYSLSSAAIRRAETLSEMYLNDSRQRMNQLQRKEEAIQSLKSHEKYGSLHIEVFHVASELMGFVIGSHGSNIDKARKVEGVKDIEVHECSKVNGTFKISIYSETPAAAEQARALLEFAVDHVVVPSQLVGQIIGKKGSTLQELLDKSGVARVNLREGDHEVTFKFTGLKDSVSLVRLLIEYRIKHISEMDEIREIVNDINRQISIFDGKKTRSFTAKTKKNGESDDQQKQDPESSDESNSKKSKPSGTGDRKPNASKNNGNRRVHAEN